ncbi:hypothetical protein BN7_4273 [Wickerhamomyces ciferrii]|uniref:Uncharacterized protein n=1 Tax=Wickerhamomyces ciferrii (strain ATCC 14091 / BCRC 22168 / CBS 111 / JCM 3599 / NBRC 0793 / NRRL Y-1031 F-60-10) TaxID=1206466 RepID=K0KHL9_WICCF|nr:uncharacterized protein BN7_4273 [Wickerhamomyces ciferrii]CCH44705.1 hypothetical protein BN7_4273 [Wickerhamomyces ciferrii]
MSQDNQSVRRRPSKASTSAKSVIAYEPFEASENQNENQSQITRGIPTISIEQDQEQEQDYEEGEDVQRRDEVDYDDYGDDGSIIYPRITKEGTYEDSYYTNTRTNTFDPINTNDDSYLYRGTSSQINDMRLKKSNTQTGNGVTPDRLNDKVPSARPNVDYQDRLWTQIDVLDDVKKMSEQTSIDNDSFFNAKHGKALDELRLAQIELLSTIRNSEKLIDLNIDHQDIWNSQNIDGIRDKMYNKKYFDTISTSVDKVNNSLDSVGKSMKTLDEMSKDIWNS